MSDDQLLLWIQALVRRGSFAFTDHALTKHPAAERFTANDAIAALLTGSMIQHREEDARYVICGKAPDIMSDTRFHGRWIHCVVQYDHVTQLLIITFSDQHETTGRHHFHEVPSTIRTLRKGRSMARSGESRDSRPLCTECGGDMEDTHGDLVFAYVPYTITVADVPMQLCRQCGERLVPGPVRLAISQMVAEIHESMRTMDVDDADSSAPTDAITIHYAARRDLSATVTA